MVNLIFTQSTVAVFFLILFFDTMRALCRIQFFNVPTAEFYVEW